MSGPQPSLRPTRPSDLLLAGVLGAAASVIVEVIRRHAELAKLPASLAITIGLLAIAELAGAQSVRARLAGKPRTRPILPTTVARMAALARASSLTGALLVGIWLVLLIDRLRRVADDVTAARHDAIVAGIGVVTGGLLIVAALRLESACRLPKPPDRTEPEEPDFREDRHPW